MSGKRRGVLSDEDRTLWDRVKASVTPMHPAPRKPILRDTATAAHHAGPAKPSRPKRHAPPSWSPPPAPKRPVAPPQAATDREEARAIASGKIEIDAWLDLHGLRQAEAHRALIGFLVSTQMKNHRLVLVITGRGDPEAAPGRFLTDSPRGVLRAAVPHWLGEPRLKSVVVGWSPAHRRHGGDGALYVRLKRLR